MLRIFDWGVRDSTPRVAASARWPEMRRVTLRGGDMFLTWRVPTHPTIPGCYFPRESFQDEDEARFCHELIHELHQSQGQSWSAARSRLLARQTLRRAFEPDFDLDTPRPHSPPSVRDIGAHDAGTTDLSDPFA